jgi:hypothetical protein
MVDIDVEMISTVLEAVSIGRSTNVVRVESEVNWGQTRSSATSEGSTLYTTIDTTSTPRSRAAKLIQANRARANPDTFQMAKNANPVEAHRKNRIPAGRSVRTS